MKYSQTITRKRVKLLLGRMLLLLFGIGIYSIYFFYWDQVPEKIEIEKGKTKHLFLNIPASGTLYTEEGNEAVAEVFLEKPISVTAGMESTSYQLPLKLFGVVPFKQVGVEVVEEYKLYPVGDIYGFYLETQGVLVVGVGEFQNEEGDMVAPSEGVLRVGDQILKINGEVCSSKQELTEIVRTHPNSMLEIELERENEIISTKVQTQVGKDGNSKMGIWVRDNAQGVGTITYVDEEGCFGALGHPIMDADTGEILPMQAGRLYQTEIVKIKPGEKNHIGEMTGVIDYDPKYITGNLYLNEDSGIFGYSYELEREYRSHEAIEIGRTYEVHSGEASILCNVDGQSKEYTVEILDVRKNDSSNRAITLRVTDPELISQTGGIVQGMSGSPIIQDEKLIGAVTHVFLSDPTKGYGILIESMIE